MARLGILFLILMWSALPILLVVLSSFKNPATIFETPPRLIFKPIIRNYITLAREWPEFFTSLVNSFIITVGSASLVAAVSLITGYTYSRYRKKLLTLSAFFILAIRMLPPIIISISLFPVAHALDIDDTHFLMIILYSAFFVSLGSWIMKSFIDQIPRELDESATLDGASTFQIIRMIILPLGVHGIIAVFIFVAIFAWKEYLLASIFTAFTARTAPIVTSQMLSSVTGTQWGPLMAAAVIQLLPILVFVLVTQKFLVKTFTIGAVKG